MRSTARYRKTMVMRDHLSAAAALRQRTENRGSVGADLVTWQAALAKHWSALRFGPATVEQQGERYLFHVQVFLDDMDPDAVKVELYAERHQSQIVGRPDRKRDGRNRRDPAAYADSPKRQPRLTIAQQSQRQKGRPRS